MSAVDLSKGAVHYHFKRKYDIYIAVVEKFYIQQVKKVGKKDSYLDFVQRIKNRYEIFREICGNLELLGPIGIEFPIGAYLYLWITIKGLFHSPLGEGYADSSWLELTVRRTVYIVEDSFPS